MKKTLHLNKVWVLLSCILMVVVVLTACAQPAKQPATATATPSTAAGPKSGGTLKIGLSGAGPISLDSFSGFTANSGAIWKTYAQTLVRWVGKNDQGATVAPLAAKSWEISPDGLTYTFHLQEGVKWQKTPLLNEREFTADDLVYHYNRVNDPANKFVSRVTLDIKNCEAPDKYTFKITTNQKNPGFLVYMAHGSGIPYPKEIVEAAGGPGKNWIGTGPFILSDYDKDTKAIFKKNPDYWNKGKPYLDSVEFYFMQDPATRLAAFRAGQIDVLPSEGKANRDAIEKSVPNAKIQDGVGMMEYGLLLNNTRPPFDNKLVRQAIQYAIDYDGLINSALDGAGVRTGYLAPWWSEWGGKQAADLPKRDLAKAKALLAQAGYPDGFKTTIMQNTGAMDVSGNAIEPLVAMLKDVGIQASIVQNDNASFVSKWRASDFDMTIHLCYTARPYDVNNSIQQMWLSNGTANFMKYKNPKVDELIVAQQAAFPDKEKRIPIVKQIISILEEDVPSIPLYVINNYFIKQSWVKGWDDMADPQAASATGSLPWVWIEK